MVNKLVETATLATKLLKQHGLYEQGWRFEFSKEKWTIGRCDYERKLIRHSLNYLANTPEDEIKDTLLHEIAHALVGPHVKSHGYEWQAMAMKVGAKPYATDWENASQSAPRKFNYVMRCPECGQEWKRYRMRKRNFGSKCPKCDVEVEIYKYVRR